MKLRCKTDAKIQLELDAVMFEDAIAEDVFPPDRFGFIGLALHSIQQGQAKCLYINGYAVKAVLMDQTGGSISQEDIVETSHPERPYQRLKNVVFNNLEIQ